MLLISAITFGMLSCGDDDLAEGDLNETEAASAYLQVYGDRTPSGIIEYMRVTEGIPAEIDLSQSLELGQNVSVVSQGEDIFVINASASTITKWEVDKSTLEPRVTGALSFASTGITTTSTTVFLSGTQCFLADLHEGAILEWNPESMKITKVHAVEQAALADHSSVNLWPGSAFALPSGKVAWTMYYFPTVCCEDIFADGVSVVGVFDPAIGAFNYKSDTRLAFGGYGVQGDDGNIYTMSNAEQAWIRHYFYNEPADYKLLRLDDNGNFDPSFEFDLSSVANVNYRPEVIAWEGNNVALNYFALPDTVNNPDAWEERFSLGWIIGLENMVRREIFNLETGEVEPFTAFDEYNGPIWRVGTVDGAPYVGAMSFNESRVGTSDLFRQESIDNFTLVTKGSPNVNLRNFNRLW